NIHAETYRRSPIHIVTSSQTYRHVGQPKVSHHDLRSYRLRTCNPGVESLKFLLCTCNRFESAILGSKCFRKCFTRAGINDKKRAHLSDCSMNNNVTMSGSEGNE